MMIFGMTVSTYTFVHVLLSLVGIGSGLIVLLGLLARKRLDGWTALFLATTVATSITGFGFPFDHLLPSHKVGILSPRRRLALDLRILRRGCPLSECLRVGRSGISEGSRLESIGADTIRAAISYNADGRFGAFRCAYRYRGDPIPQRATSCALMGHIACPLRRVSERTRRPSP